MRISRIKIYNYRSIRELELHCKPLVIMIGPNNHGKSNILSAIEFALSATKPAADDFFVFGDKKKLWVELTFHNLTEQERITFKRYVRTDNSICVRKTATWGEYEGPQISYNGYIQEPRESWLKENAIDSLTNRDAISPTPLKEFIPTSGRILRKHVEEAQAKYIEAHHDELVFDEILEVGNFMGVKTIAVGLLPDLYMVPAVRDLSEETKIKSTTSFGRLLNRAVQEMTDRHPGFQGIIDSLDKLVKTLNSEGEGRPEQLGNLEKNLETELQQWDVSVSIQITPPDIGKIFELGTTLNLNDGIETSAERKGQGLQRALIFALMKAWAKALRTTPTTGGIVPRKASESIVFAFEEPELFLHPHAQRQLARDIQNISRTPNHQIFVTTHSTHFIDLDYYRSICIISKNSAQEGTIVKQCMDDLFEKDGLDDRRKRFHMAEWINPDRAEMFFAKRVIFVEGETEKTVLPFLAEKLEKWSPDISIIECGGKNNLILYIAIANAFRIRYIVLHDEDPLPDLLPENKDEVRALKRTFALNEKIRQAIDPRLGTDEEIKPDFERMSGVSRNQADKKGKALAAIEYFEEKSVEEIPPILKAIVEKIYAD